MTYMPARNASFDVEGGTQIDDDDIKKAFEARPQMPKEVRVAYYTFDPEVAHDLDASLASMPGVASAYRIPPLLVNGQRRVEQDGWGPKREVTVKKLRLLAARAHADVLVVVDHGYRTGGANGLAALNVLVLPMLFVPFLDNTVDGYAEGYVIDVRNGYLYGHVSEDDRRGKRFATIYDPNATEVAHEQWGTLHAALLKDLAVVLADGRSGSHEARGLAAARPADPPKTR
jgi:hypothetical protein